MLILVVRLGDSFSNNGQIYTNISLPHKRVPRKCCIDIKTTKSLSVPAEKEYNIYKYEFPQRSKLQDVDNTGYLKTKLDITAY